MGAWLHLGAWASRRMAHSRWGRIIALALLIGACVAITDVPEACRQPNDLEACG